MFYDFSIEFDETCIRELEPFRPQPTPDQEIKRSEVLDQLSNYLKELLRKYLEIEYVPTMFSRWLFLQIATKNPTTEDPILRRPEVVLDNKKNTIRDIIVDNYPVSTYIPWTGVKGRSNVLAIKETISKWVSKISNYKVIADDEDFRKIKELVNSKEKNPDVLFQGFRSLKNSLKPKIDKMIGVQIETLFEKLIKKTKKLLKELTFTEQDYHVSTENISKGSNVMISYEGERFEITQEHYKKLSKLFIQERSMLDLDTSIWVLLKRYSKFICDPEDKSEQFHAAAPKSFFDLIKEQYDVSFECFASPLNCYFKNFCSAFVDTDSCFGSKGSFFYFKPTCGAFEVNPPYVEEVMEYTADHIIDLLNKTSKEPLFFIVGVPDWREPLQKGQEKIENSTFLKGQFVLEGKKYEYISGGQHKCLKTFNMPFMNRFYLLQNKVASRKWQINQERIDEIKKAFETRK